MNRLIVVLVAITFLAACAPSPPDSPPQPPLHLYLLAGQSNMAGRGPVDDISRQTHPRVFALTATHEWKPATDPLHWDKPNIVGVGPGLSFGKEMAERFPNAHIGLIPAAVGGSSVRAWQPGEVHPQTNSRPWDDAVSRVFRVLAFQGGELKGVIWHQGESDRADFTSEYEDAVVNLVERMRTEFRAPDLPFVAAQLSSFGQPPRKGTAEINAAIANLPGRLSNTAFVSGEGFAHKGDDVHLDTASERELGRRYADAMHQLLTSQ